MISTKHVVIAVGVALAVGGTAHAAYHWFKRPQWKQEAADKTFDDLLDVYNQAVQQFPDDRAKAEFTFALAAAQLKATFGETYSQYEQYEAWVVQFDEHVKSHSKSFRKN